MPRARPGASSGSREGPKRSRAGAVEADQPSGVLRELYGLLQVVPHVWGPDWEWYVLLCTAGSGAVRLLVTVERLEHFPGSAAS